MSSTKRIIILSGSEILVLVGAILLAIGLTNKNFENIFLALLLTFIGIILRVVAENEVKKIERVERERDKRKEKDAERWEKTMEKMVNSWRPATK